VGEEREKKRGGGNGWIRGRGCGGGGGGGGGGEEGREWRGGRGTLGPRHPFSSSANDASYYYCK